MERFQSGLFRRIVLLHMIQALVLSITGIVDSAVVGQFWEAEGLAGNSLLHGFKDDREKYIEYRFIIVGRWLILRLRDNGRPFDLTERYKMLNPDDPVAGLGLRIVFAAAENVNYSHAFDINNVCIRILKKSNRRLTD